MSNEILLGFIIFLYVLVIILFYVVNSLLDAVRTNQSKLKEIYNYLNDRGGKNVK